MFLLYFFVFLLMLVFLIHQKMRRIFKEVEHIPGPPLMPFLGNALEMGRNSTDLLRNFKRLTRQYGPVVRLCVGWKVFVLISDPNYMLQAIKSNEAQRNLEFYEHLRPLLGKGLFTVTGETWNRHRKVLNRSFGAKQLEKYTTTFNKNANKLVSNLSKMVGPHSVDITNEIYNCALNTVCNAVMQVDVSENIDYRTAAEGLMDLSTSRFYSPLKNFDFFYRLTDDFKLQKKYLRTLDKFYEFVLAKRKMHISSKEHADDTSRAIVDDLLNVQGEDAFTHEEVRGEMQSLIVAGSESMGSTLALLLFELTKHPEVQEKILEETRQVLGPNKQVDVSFEDLHRLKYTESVVREVLRLYSPAYLIPKQLIKEAKFGGITIPAGTNLLLHVGGMHLSPDFYPNPEKFIPDRFLVDNPKDSRPIMSFSVGSNMCIGHKFSILEANTFVAKLVRNFEFLPAQPEHHLVLKLEGVVKSANGVPIILKPRE